jgi:hypothetical protein
MPIKSFRGKIADDGIDTISLHTTNGSTGYKIKKFLGLPAAPGTDNFESVIKIYSVSQTTATNTMDFNDQTLLGVIFYSSYGVGGANTDIVIFDNVVFNQDIYVTYKEAPAAASGESFNFYIELEQVKLDLTENTVATLKDIRNIVAQ